MRTNASTALVWTTLGLIFALSQWHCFAAEFHKTYFNFEGRAVAYDLSDSGTDKPVILVLHGASGPDISVYREQARFFSEKGFTTILLHYFDATKSSTATSENYRTWARLVDALVRQIARDSTANPRKIFLVGFSLGASVALAAGSQDVPVSAIAEWYGSLPDDFFYTMKGMPPLLILHGQQDGNIPVSNAQQLIRLCGVKHLECESHIYPDQGHGFGGQALSDADARTIQFLSKYASAP